MDFFVLINLRVFILMVFGLALMFGLVDYVIMIADVYVFVFGSMMVEEFTGVPMSKEELGGPTIHDRTSGVASFVVADEEEADALAAELLSFLPDHTDDHPNQALANESHK